MTPTSSHINPHLARVVDRWRTAMKDGDVQFSSDGIDAVVGALLEFERRARSARLDVATLQATLRQTVLELACIGGLEGRYGCFLETDEREELVPYLLDIVQDCGWAIEDGEDPTEPYRTW